MSSSAIISGKDLSVGYDSGIILSGINFTLSPGKLVCLMGPNGAGKSTLLKSISGILKIKEGILEIQGKSIRSYPPGALAKIISTVLTEKPSASNLSVYELVELGRYPHTNWRAITTETDDKKISDAIRLTGIGSLVRQPLYTLSDGQLQKALIARALAQDCPVMILDEPTHHLDMNNRIEVMQLLSSLAHQSGKAIIMTTHELDTAVQMADELWLINAEKKLVRGIPEDVILSGELDKAFPTKGYDIKTGKVVRNPIGKKVCIEGEGYLYLWTKNALERNNFNVIPIEEEAEIKVNIKNSTHPTHWEVEKEGTIHTVHSLESLIQCIQ
ncbi:MAG: ABC transporter ATP-binding protein [Cyclobacteriaceae bacterium]|nr:ABC transporter ATP-binding protein [Cyclobacteriaceae bacterium]